MVSSRGSPSRQRRPGRLRRGSAATRRSGVGDVNKPSNIALDATARQGVPSGSKRCRGPRTDMMDFANQVSGKSVSHVAPPDPRRLEIHFTDDSVLAMVLIHGYLAAALTRGRGDATSDPRHDGPQPTHRQREYLEFIARYIRRYGVSPAESDIARHFLVSAPSTN